MNTLRSKSDEELRNKAIEIATAVEEMIDRAIDYPSSFIEAEDRKEALKVAGPNEEVAYVYGENWTELEDTIFNILKRR